MLGVTFRAALQALASVLVIAVLAEVMSYLLDPIGHESHWLLQSFDSVVTWALTICLASLCVLLLARAITENRLPG